MSQPTPCPPELAELRVVEVDVREDIRRGQEPFARIVGAAKALAAGEALVVRAPFEPVPLYAVLGRRGLAHWTEPLAGDDWRVWFWPERIATATPREPATGAGATLDVRGLAPPQPMVRVLEALDTLAPGGVLTVLHERRPLFLYPQLDALGLCHETHEVEPGVVRIVISRPRT